MYSAEKKCECMIHNGRVFIVLDHALSEHFNLMNLIFHGEESNPGWLIPGSGVMKTDGAAAEMGVRRIDSGWSAFAERN